MVRGGVMTRNKLHAHNTMFDRCIYFVAEAKDLGLDDPKFMPDISYRPLLLDQIDFASNDAVQEFVLTNLASAQRDWDARCKGTNACSGKPRPQILCESWVSNEDFIDPASGKVFAYDRRAPACCRDWTFKKGDTYVVVAFMQAMKTPPGPWQPNNTPPVANMHIHWLMTYASEDERSHYGIIMHSQNPKKQRAEERQGDYPLWISLENSLYGSGGPVSRDLTWMEYFDVAWHVFCVRMQPFDGEIMMLEVGLIFAFSMCLMRTFRSYFRAKQAMNHPVVRCVTEVPCCPDTAVDAAKDGVRSANMVQHDE
eukprot:gnl/TRDRNA2_/TRDRNA2_149723_c2_seq1.p1 gnl/TRDRNA2_/TRDRNA2_149723_c2~~gnl/TRDRNA2_/TRDRNA2_149723_c2_seq1.p1  ORF type:complete len:354 (+),score=63.93 gnl/TRDRNA2_/TRDRNA2_149723_c2_seq1:131-1063(+)